MTDCTGYICTTVQVARQQLVQSLLRPPSNPATPSSGSPEVAPPDQPQQAPEVGRYSPVTCTAPCHYQILCHILQVADNTEPESRLAL